MPPPPPPTIRSVSRPFERFDPKSYYAARLARRHEGAQR
jgi:hypothetical protein